jgi:aryl-alcohol dehydrogenase-like predicted oxidoreductase
MEYRSLGLTGTKVSALCLGTMTFGEADDKSFMHQVGCDEPTAHAIMDLALDRGVNFFDTADVYGQDGLTERVLGSWFKRSNKRDQVILASKFRFRMEPGPNGTGASRHRIMRAVEESLRRLATDRIDLYQVHMQDIETPEEETLRALDDLVRQGKILYFGASNYAGYRLVDSAWISEAHNLNHHVTLQAAYSLVERGIERELVPACRRFGIGILPYSPLAGGFLSGKYRRNEPPPPGARLEKWKERYGRFDNDRNWRIMDAVRAVADESKTTPSAVAMGWLLAQPEVTSVIFGARSVAQLEENLRAAEVKLTEQQVARLTEASAFELGYPYEFIKRVQPRW